MMVPFLGHHQNTLYIYIYITHIDLLNNIFIMPHLGIMAPHLGYHQNTCKHIELLNNCVMPHLGMMRPHLGYHQNTCTHINLLNHMHTFTYLLLVKTCKYYTDCNTLTVH